MRDFSLDIYRQFVATLIDRGYSCCSYLEQIQAQPSKFAILRHDVDKLPQNSLETAKIQHELGVSGTYYFRCVKESFDPKMIEAIRDLGHEIGYHYEDMSLTGGDANKAIEHFEHWLEKLREFYPVKTVCMHGSPLSSFDNRDIWKSFDYKDYNIIAEPYFDIDFKSVLYITDTGRSWNKTKSSVRDKVDSPFDYSFKSTEDLIRQVRKDKLPDKIMQNIHPQRWTNDSKLWWKELILQNAKNVIKQAIYVKK